MLSFKDTYPELLPWIHKEGYVQTLLFLNLTTQSDHTNTTDFTSLNHLYTMKPTTLLTIISILSPSMLATAYRCEPDPHVQCQCRKPTTKPPACLSIILIHTNSLTALELRAVKKLTTVSKYKVYGWFCEPPPPKPAGESYPGAPDQPALPQDGT